MKARHGLSTRVWLLGMATLLVAEPGYLLLAEQMPQGQPRSNAGPLRHAVQYQTDAPGRITQLGDSRANAQPGTPTEAPGRFPAPPLLERIPSAARAGVRPSVAGPRTPGPVAPGAREIQLTGQQRGQNDVLQHLQELYEKDGRAMPNMKLRDLPSYHPGMGEDKIPAQPVTRPRHKPSALDRTKSFFKKLNPFSRDSKPSGGVRPQPRPNRPLPTAPPAADPPQRRLRTNRAMPITPPREFNAPATKPRPIQPQQPSSETPPAAERKSTLDSLPTLQIPDDEIPEPQQKGTTVRSPALKVEVIRPSDSDQGDDIDASFPDFGEDQADQGATGRLPAADIPPPAEPDVDELPVITPRGTFVPPPARPKKPQPKQPESKQPDEEETNPFTRPQLDDNPFEQPDEQPAAPEETRPDERPLDLPAETEADTVETDADPKTETSAPTDNNPFEADAPIREPETVPDAAEPQNPFENLDDPFKTPGAEATENRAPGLPDAEEITAPAAPQFQAPPAEKNSLAEPKKTEVDGPQDEDAGLPNLPAPDEERGREPGAEPAAPNDLQEPKRVRSQDDLPPLPKPEQPEPQRIAQPKRRTRQEKMQLIQSRAGQPGLQGFCPVVLRDDRGLEDAKPEFSSSFDSKSYYFSSLEAKEKFDAHPERYAPAAAGHDVVLLAEETEDVEGSLLHAAWFRDRLYLFSTAVTKAKFVSRPSQYVVE